MHSASRCFDARRLDPTVFPNKYFRNIMDQSPYPETIKCLNEERIKLLKEIKKYSHYLDGNDNACLEGLKARYNTLIDRLDRSSLGDPFKVLPPELWPDIIYNLLADYRSVKWEIDYLLPLTSVSRHWQQIILSTPSFWDCIRITEKTEDLEAKLATCIHLSKDLPLDIYFVAPPSLWDTIGSIIVAQSSRIRTVHLLILGSPVSAVHSTLTSILNSFGKLSALEDLSLFNGLDDDAAGYASLYTLLKNATTIRSLTSRSISPEIFRLGSMQKIECLTSYLPYSEILPHLSALRYLKAVRLNNSPISAPTPEINRAIPPDDRKGDNAQKLTYKPQGWTSLWVCYHLDSLLWPLLDSISLTLTSLDIPILFDSLPNLIQACSYMPNLHSLSMALTISEDVNFQPFSADSYVLHIQHLSVRLLYSESLEVVTSYQSLAERFAQALIAWAPDVKHLFFSTFLDPSPILPYIQSLQQLATLSVGTFLDQPEPLPITELSAVESVNISGSCVPILTALSCPSILKLTIHPIDAIEERFFFQPIRLHPTKWLNLRTIEINSDDAMWDRISLPGVEEITFGSNSGLWSPDPSHISPSLLKELACNSSAFPSLKYLGIRNAPNWDILLLMLERRNFLDSNESTTITKLGLPIFPAPMILRPLVDRLRRKLTDRSSNFDISLQSVAKGYFDTEL